MRLQLNLNQYYDGLNTSQVNEIFSMFVYMKGKIEQLKLTFNAPDNEKDDLWKVTLKVYSKSVYERANCINLYMQSVGKEEIFVIGNTIEDTDFEAIISKYEYLMSEPDSNS